MSEHPIPIGERGLRYLRQSPDDEALKEFVSTELHTLEYEEALDWYLSVHPALTDAQRAYLGCNDRFYLMLFLLDRKDMLHPWLFARCREVEWEPDGYLDLWARYHFKAVDLKALVPTPDGWRRHGDLAPGDRVFGPDGKPTRVIARTPVFTDADCYRITFDKGYQVVVSGDHLWTVDIASRARSENGREGRRTVTLNTRELMAEVVLARQVEGRVFPSVPVAAPLSYEEKSLPIPPYTLGAWLGDGTSSSSGITVHHDDEAVLDRIRADGFNVVRRGERYGATIYGLRPRLREAGILGDKHIPAAYLEASIGQRWELLRGLMDTDGHCDTRGTATFCGKSEILAECVFLLAASLGLKPSMRRHAGIVNGEAYPFYQVSFQARAEGEPVFHLARKQARAIQGRATRSARHAIVDVAPVPSIPVSCIQVEREDGLYLIGEECVVTHNSSIITQAGTIQEIVIDPEITIAILSENKEIAQPFLAQIKRSLETNGLLKRVYDDVLWRDTRAAPLWSATKGIIVKRKGQPKEPTVGAYGIVNGMPTGVHFRMLIYDDMLDLRSVSNEDMVRKVTTAFEMSTNLGVGEATRRQMVGTRYSYADTYGALIEREVVEERRYPATDNGQPDGNPVFMTAEAWATVKNEQRSTVASQMLQDPLAGSENTFDVRWFRPWEVRPANLNVYIMCDPSMGSTSKSDRTAIAVVGVDPNNVRYLLDGYRHRMKLSERYEALKTLHKKWTNMPGVQNVVVGYERFGCQSDLEVMAEYMLRDKYVFNMEELAWPREGPASKKHRVGRLEPDFRQSRFLLPARIWNINKGGSCQWRIGDPAKGERLEVIYEAQEKPSRLMMLAEKAGQGHRVAKPIRRKDEDGNVYDVTKALMDEMLLFPFAPKDDLVDATSRIYDIGPVPAMTRANPEEDYRYAADA